MEKDAVKLAQKAKHGNAKAYGELIELYKNDLYKTAWLYVKDQQRALDIVGDCILNGFRAVHTLKDPAYFKTWLTRILINAAKDYCRKNPIADTLEDLPLETPAASTSLEEKLDLYQAIDRLSDRYRTVIILKYFDGLKVSEIAEIMNIPQGSVKAYLNRARAELRKLLKEDHIYENRISEYSSPGRVRSCCGGEYETGVQRV